MATTFKAEDYASDNAAPVYETSTTYPCTSFEVTCDSGSANPARVKVSPMHDATEDGFPIPAGETKIFRCREGGINSVLIVGDGGTTTCSGGIVAAT